MAKTAGLYLPFWRSVGMQDAVQRRLGPLDRRTIRYVRGPYGFGFNRTTNRVWGVMGKLFPLYRMRG